MIVGIAGETTSCSTAVTIMATSRAAVTIFARRTCRRSASNCRRIRPHPPLDSRSPSPSHSFSSFPDLAAAYHCTVIRQLDTNPVDQARGSTTCGRDSRMEVAMLERSASRKPARRWRIVIGSVIRTPRGTALKTEGTGDEPNDADRRPAGADQSPGDAQEHGRRGRRSA